MVVAAVVSGARVRSGARSATSLASLALSTAQRAYVSRQLDEDAVTVNLQAVSLLNRSVGFLRGFEGHEAKTWGVSRHPDVQDVAELLKAFSQFLLLYVRSLADVNSTHDSEPIRRA